MPKIFDETIADYKDFSDKTSVAIRALSLGVLAVTWLVITGGEKSAALAAVLPGTAILIWSALAFAVTALIFDAGQYFVTTLNVGRYYDVLDFLFKRYGEDVSPCRRESLWGRANGYGLISLIVAKGSDADPQSMDVEDARTKAAEILGQLRRDRAGFSTTASEPDRATARLEAALDESYRTPGAISTSRVLFVAKIVATAVAGLCLVVYLIWVAATTPSSDETCAAWRDVKSDVSKAAALPANADYRMPGVEEMAKERSAQLSHAVKQFETSITQYPVVVATASQLYVDRLRVEIAKLGTRQQLDAAEVASIEGAQAGVDRACRSDG